MSGPAGPGVVPIAANAKQIGFEGPFLFKANGKYYLSGAEFVDGDYQTFIASATNIYGPYSNRYLSVPHGGHNVFFQDKDGNWGRHFLGTIKIVLLEKEPGYYAGRNVTRTGIAMVDERSIIANAGSEVVDSVSDCRPQFTRR